MKSLQNNTQTRQTKYTIVDIAEMGMMLALIEAVKRALEFIPNVEMVTLLFILFSIYYGKRVILVSFAFTALETFVWGISTWNVMYLYIWPLLIIIVCLSREHGSYIFYALLSAFYGLFFGALCSIPYFFIGGPVMMFNWWISGIPYDILHCISNFILCLILFKPLSSALAKISRLNKNRIAY